MAHTYIITAAILTTDVQPNDTVQISGTVDGFPVVVTAPQSFIAGLPNALALQNYLAPLMLAAAVASGKIAPAAPTTVPAVTSLGTFSQ